jgi:murein tripeptide amidase MpaA
MGDAATGDQLREAGFHPTIDQKLRPAEWAAPSSRLVAGAPESAVAPIDETYYGGYHTVKAQFAHLDKVATDKPALATVVDYGDSYLKTRNPATGYDLKAICLTHKQTGDCALTPSAPKPRFLLMTQIHAREIVTGDLAWKFIDHLATGYGTDAQVTALLNSTEVWVVPISNPDGVDLVQQGGNTPYLQRKNLNTNGGNCANPPNAFSQVGVDLNRNNGDHWNTSGTSPQLCSQTYPGRSADSEPETKGLEGLFRNLWPDQRGPADGDAAPATTRGAMITMHSYAGMNLYPWGWSTRNTANEAKLKAIAQQMTKFNGYQNGQPGDILYNASGGNDDWAYGQLGVASFTIETASCNSFTPRYSCTTTDFNKNLGALMYVADKAKAPYA